MQERTRRGRRRDALHCGMFGRLGPSASPPPGIGRAAIVLAIGFAIAGAAHGMGAPPRRAAFGDGVSAIFQVRCVRCHGPTEVSGGLRLDTYDAVMRGGDRGPAITPGNPGTSVLFQKVIHRDRPSMPPRKTLAVAEVRQIQRWIESGSVP
jgi:mono/diheme cytochrome c family protein